MQAHLLRCAPRAPAGPVVLVQLVRCVAHLRPGRVDGLAPDRNEPSMPRTRNCRENRPSLAACRVASTPGRTRRSRRRVVDGPAHVLEALRSRQARHPRLEVTLAEPVTRLGQHVERRPVGHQLGPAPRRSALSSRRRADVVWDAPARGIRLADRWVTAGTRDQTYSSYVVPFVASTSCSRAVDAARLSASGCGAARCRAGRRTAPAPRTPRGGWPPAVRVVADDLAVAARARGDVREHPVVRAVTGQVEHEGEDLAACRVSHISRKIARGMSGWRITLCGWPTTSVSS